MTILEHLLTESQTLCLLAIFFLVSCAQIISAGLLFNRRRADGIALNLAYELLLCAHLWLMGALANSIGHGWYPVTLGLWVICPPLEPLFWLDLPIAVFGTVICIGRKKPVMLLEIAFVMAATPPVMDLLGGYMGIYLILDAAFFVFRTGSAIAYRVLTAERFLPRSAPIDAMQGMPEGIAFIRRGCRVRFANDAMRRMLAAIDVSVDLSTVDEIIGKIEAAPGEWLWRQSRQGEPSLAGGAKRVVETPAGSFCQFAMSVDAAKAETILLGLDVTDERMIQAEERALQAQLESERVALGKLMDRIEGIAAKDALVKMRSKIHDVIGQRLSILHRLLEEDPSRERIAMMISTVRDMMEDVNGDVDASAQAKLDAIVESFGFAGIEIEVDGVLPNAKREGDVLVGIIREASTNAVLHSQANRVYVTIGQEEGILVMDVESDGEPLGHENEEGTGIAGMRRALAEVEGRLSITKRPSYKLRVEMRMPAGEDARHAREGRQR